MGLFSKKKKPALILHVKEPGYLGHNPDPGEFVYIPPVAGIYGNLAAEYKFTPLMPPNGAGLLSYNLYPFMDELTLTFEQSNPPLYTPADNGESLEMDKYPQGVVTQDYEYYEGPIDEDLIFNGSPEY